MSDSVTNVEVEDVISSIRRLFKEDKPQRDDDVVAKTEKASVLELKSDKPLAEAKPRDALVLTPAFRVNESQESEAKPVRELESADDSAASENRETEKPRKALFRHRTDPLVLSTPLSDEQIKDDTPSASSSSDELRADISRAQSRLEATIAELEAAISGQQSDWEPDGSEIAGSTPETQPLEEVDDEIDAELARALTPSEQPIDIAFMRRQKAQESKPVLQPVETPAQDDTAANVHEIVPQPTTENLPQEESAFDEEALRELVSEIVRSELQGALGERITRNVRKLVRREIHRIVSSPDFD
ncbi:MULTISPECIES: hypothetical protein [Halocynthiibacter]|uniref:Uncharacterized protein n=1 Tax=Halocynthiibacter halioticoli TaxID=2986804 RepID=A0AAE3J1R0_9RHOB|nr:MULTISPECIES: hypothetical protein [Halocynthiibacter]MCV6825006.1 hypothetical protein [Halocynthiibacter halioticoli]MCW4058007.1 hypothetical protein [Halocynthiibacter sp. SDUM655004]